MHCKYDDRGLNDQPCDSCDHVSLDGPKSDNWQPKDKKDESEAT
jgi:hypothetical protein